jgi:glycerol-3-phosphate acyltransferase PlsX
VRPIAVDAMGGDLAPSEIVEGARWAARELGIPVTLVGRRADLPDVGELEVVEASQVIAMGADPAASVRAMKDASMVRAAELVRDGKAAAMVGAGNTGATMASALLRMGRIRGVARPAIATPLPIPGSTPVILLDAGANADCQPEWLVQFAQMGAVFARERFGIARPRVGLLSIGEEPTKGSNLVKSTHALLAGGQWIGGEQADFVGNVEGRDVLTGAADVVVTDGFTGNVVLKTLEGGLQHLMSLVDRAFEATEGSRAAAERLRPELDPLRATLEPESTGGAMLLGVEGVCIISHGSSSARAILNAIAVARDMVEGEVVEHLRAATRTA